MAFDAAKAGEKRPGAGGGGAGGGAGGGDGASPLDATYAVSQKVWTLSQTAKSIDTLTGGVGGPSDAPSLRARIQAAEAAGVRLARDVEDGVRRVRVAAMTAADHSAQRQVKRLEDQYAAVRAAFVKAVNDSRTKRAQFKLAPAATAAAGAGAGGAAGAAAAGSFRRAAGAGAGTDGIEIQLHQLTDVDAAIAEVGAVSGARGPLPLPLARRPQFPRLA
jgi:hypothetical protein